MREFILTQRRKDAENAEKISGCLRHGVWGSAPASITSAHSAPLRLCVKTLSAALITFLSVTANALPLIWRADWPGSKPIETLVHRGTDIELEPQWYINGEMASSTNWTFTTYIQTNNQATGEWFGPLPGAAFSHTNDVGSAFYNVMVRAQMPNGGVNYTAFARLRMLDSPGYTPGALPLPVSTIDFSQVVAINAPWLLPDATNATLQAARSYTDRATNATLTAARDYADDVSTLNSPGLGEWRANPSTIDYRGEQVPTCTPEYGWFPDQDGTLKAGWYWVNPDGVYEDLYSSDLNATNLYGYFEHEIYFMRESQPGYILGAQSNKVVAAQTALSALRDTLATDYYTIAETDDAIDALAAYYIASDAQGSAFATYASLTNATVFYSGGVVRTPTRNDYCVVLADETHGGAEWRYIYTVAAGATSGQWDAQYPIETNDYDGLSNKPQINGVSLSGNKTGADLGVLDLSGGTMTGNLTVYNGDGPYVEIKAATAENSIAIRQRGRVSTLETDDDTYVIPRHGGTFALTSDIDLAISPTSPAFSNAVLSVGLGIDTNTVAAINELVDSAHDLPVTGATSVGALLLALAAAIAALKKRLSYAISESIPLTVTSGAASTTLDDRTHNARTVAAPGSGNTTTVTATLPPIVAGKSRDMFLNLTVGSAASDAGDISLSIVEQSGATVQIDIGSVEDIGIGKNEILISENALPTTSGNVTTTHWLITVRHEDFAS